MNFIWTSEKDEILIDFVKSHDALYNIKHPFYRKPHMKQNLWDSIGKTLEVSGSDCLKRWCYIRDYYVRKKARPGTGPCGQAARRRSELLSFLDEGTSSLFLVDTENHDVLPSENWDCQLSGEVELVEDNGGEPPRKRIHHAAEEQTDNDMDGIDLFYKSIALTVRKLPRKDQIELQMKICNLVGQVELKNLNESSNSNG